MLLFKRSNQWQFTECCRFKWSFCVFSWEVWISKKKAVHQTIPWNIHIRMHLSIASCARVIQIEKKNWTHEFVERNRRVMDRNTTTIVRIAIVYDKFIFLTTKKKRTIAFSIIIAFWFSLQPGLVHRIRAWRVRKHEACNTAVRMTKTTLLVQASME